MKIKFIPTTEGAKLIPPEPLKVNLPNWYKNMSPLVKGAEDIPLREGGHFTIKKCIPILDYMTSGYLLKFTTDIMVKPEYDETSQGMGWKIPEAMKIVDVHPHGQCPIKINGLERHYIRVNSEYIVKTPAGYSCLVFQPILNFERRFTFFSAIIDTDVYDGEMKATGWVENVDPFLIAMGTPMIGLFPFKRDEWKMEISEQLFDTSKGIVDNLTRRKFYNFYKQFFHKKKKFD